MIQHFCNQCKQPVIRNMVTDPLMVESGIFNIQVTVRPSEASGDEALCLGCLMKALNKRPYVRKAKESTEGKE